jgi:hypothetical protein
MVANCIIVRQNLSPHLLQPALHHALDQTATFQEHHALDQTATSQVALVMTATFQAR